AVLCVAYHRRIMRRRTSCGKRAVRLEVVADSLRPGVQSAKIGGTSEGSDMARRVAVIAGCRTPFTRAGTSLSHMSPVQLGTVAVRELVNRAELDTDLVDGLIFGTVVPS